MGGGSAMPVEKITFEELEDKLRDIDLDEAALRDYFVADSDDSRPFAPILKPDPKTVTLTERDEFRIEGAFAMDWANGVARWRRQQRFRRDESAKTLKTVLVSEGDSWFQFPIFLKDVIDGLEDGYSIWCCGAAGDTLANMIDQAPEYLEALDRNRKTVKAFLFSGGGNDIVGDDGHGGSVLERVLNPFEAGRPAAWYLQTDAFNETLAFIEAAYRTMLEEVAAEFPRLPVVIHGYDYALPGGFANDPRKPRYAKPDQWIGRYLRGKVLKIKDDALGREIVKAMIDRLNEIQVRLCGGTHPGGAFPNAWHVDVRGTLRTVGDWNDELHPTDRTSKVVAKKFAKVLEAAGVT
jgi:hypothetical protein